MPGRGNWSHRYQGYFSRWTVPREAILNLLSKTSGHISAKEIYAALYRIYPGIGLTTVYRTLDLLVRMDLLNKFTFGGGESLYEIRSGEKKEHHHHLICTNCGRIIDYNEFLEEEVKLIKKTEEVLEQKYNFKVLNHNIEFYGLCDKCR